MAPAALCTRMALVGLGLLLVVDGIPRRDMMPRRSDVLLKSVEIHPGWRSGCDNECTSTLDTAATFSATRIDWIFLDPTSGETAAFLRAAGAAGLPVSAAINANMPDRKFATHLPVSLASPPFRADGWEPQAPSASTS